MTGPLIYEASHQQDDGMPWLALQHLRQTPRPQITSPRTCKLEGLADKKNVCVCVCAVWGINYLPSTPTRWLHIVLESVLNSVQFPVSSPVRLKRDHIHLLTSDRTVSSRVQFPSLTGVPKHHSFKVSFRFRVCFFINLFKPLGVFVWCASCSVR